MGRRGFLVLLGGAAVVVALNPEKAKLGANFAITCIDPPEAPIAPEAIQDERLKQHVVPLYNYLVTNFGTVDEGLYLENNRDGELKFGTAWTQSRIWDAFREARALPGEIGKDAKRRSIAVRDAFEHYWKNEPYDQESGYLPGLRQFSRKTERYIDDNLWIGLTMLQDHLETGDPHSFKRAVQVLTLSIKQWDYERGGGIPWMQVWPGSVSGRCLVSNAQAITLAVQLSLSQKDPAYFWGGVIGAKEVLGWIEGSLKDPSDGLYWDNMYIDGGIGKQKWTYGQGVMIQAKDWLNRMRPHEYPLSDAIDLLKASLRHFNEEDRKVQDALKDDPQAPETDGYKDHAYNSIFFAAALDLAKRTPKEPELLNDVLHALHTRVSRLPHHHKTALDQSGALRLAILAYKNPLSKQ